ncbi:MAG TPA: hypothetical protein VL358_09390 [Caulobacteraceae bacterium]|jgi:hypothetical protein|nr:hypothetical protein [Caulobacteraceae bacterium]
MTTFSVVRQGDAWTVVADGKRWGRFAYKVDAEETAIRLSTRAAADGGEPEVLVQTPWGEMAELKIG